ncbi:hypothetical protein KCU67_g13532, partial [Aureobasidium melanogenum]
HSQLKTGHPVRSAIHKQLNGRLVLRWVTTWESLLLYVLSFVFACLWWHELQSFEQEALLTVVEDAETRRGFCQHLFASQLKFAVSHPSGRRSCLFDEIACPS